MNRASTLSFIVLSLSTSVAACGASDSKRAAARDDAGSSGSPGADAAAGRSGSGGAPGTGGGGSGTGGASGGTTSSGGATGTGGAQGGATGTGGTGAADGGGTGGAATGGASGTDVPVGGLATPPATVDVDGCLRFDDATMQDISTTVSVDQDQVYVTVSGHWYLSRVRVGWGNYVGEFFRGDGPGGSTVWFENGNGFESAGMPGTFNMGSDFDQVFLFDRVNHFISIFPPNTGTTGTPVQSGDLGALTGTTLTIGGQGSRTCSMSYR